MAEINFGMDKGELRQMLAKSKAEPMHCAMGRGKEAFAYLLLHKSKPPRRLEEDLSKQFADMKDGRWGTCFVDEDIDPKLVNFRINKPSGGLPKRVARTLKLVGYSKVRFEFEDGSAAEEESEAEEQAQAATAAAPADTVPDARTLTPRLTAAVQRIAAVVAQDPSRRDQLLGLARQGQALIAANDHPGALDTIEALEVALDAPAPPASQTATATAATTATANFDKARQAWMSTRRMMEAELDKLRAGMIAFYAEEDEDTAAELCRNYQTNIEPLLQTLDERLAEILDDATKEADPQIRAEHVAKAQATIKSYQDFVAKEDLFKALDANPFVKVTITPVVTKTLAALAAAVH